MSGVLDNLAVPVVQAPLAGGASTPELATAVSGAGGLGFLAAGYKTAAAVAEAMDAMGECAYGVNVFAPGEGRADPAEVDRYAEHLRAEGYEPGEARYDDDHWARRSTLLLERPPAVASFTFGCPEEGLVADLREAGSEVLGDRDRAGGGPPGAVGGRHRARGPGCRGRWPPWARSPIAATSACWPCWHCWAARSTPAAGGRGRDRHGADGCGRAGGGRAGRAGGDGVHALPRGGHGRAPSPGPGRARGSRA